ncbi:MAG: 3',5'-cyclic-nucleotide phosphodiesterase [Gemmatimonadetes bacterium]|nr:3',5'-cyclic-nucleotide phosphodiesterase [Gemmatimonadota bacterium]
MLTILHASDLQCGRPFLPHAADAFVRFANQLQADVIVVAGDLTQRAKVAEFHTAKTLLERLPAVPVIVTPGNHDVPLFRLWERALAPHRNWRALISPDLDSSVRRPGATFVALNSSAPRTAIVNGRVRSRQVEFARRAFESAPEDDARVLVIHHHFVPAPDPTAGRPLPGARRLAEAFESMGVDLVLGGHVHETHVNTSRALLPGRDGPGVPLIACGTTTSRRGRGSEAGINSLNVIRVAPHEVEVLPHRLAPGARDFEPAAAIVIPRHRTSGARGAAVG